MAWIKEKTVVVPVTEYVHKLPFGSELNLSLCKYSKHHLYFLDGSALKPEYKGIIKKIIDNRNFITTVSIAKEISRYIQIKNNKINDYKKNRNNGDEPIDPNLMIKDDFKEKFKLAKEIISIINSNKKKYLLSQTSRNSPIYKEFSKSIERIYKKLISKSLVYNYFQEKYTYSKFFDVIFNKIKNKRTTNLNDIKDLNKIIKSKANEVFLVLIDKFKKNFKTFSNHKNYNYEHIPESEKEHIEKILFHSIKMILEIEFLRSIKNNLPKSYMDLNYIGIRDKSFVEFRRKVYQHFSNSEIDAELVIHYLMEEGENKDLFSDDKDVYEMYFYFERLFNYQPHLFI